LIRGSLTQRSALWAERYLFVTSTH